MPGPKMGPRPPDFDEALVRQSPSFQKWLSLANGAKLRYACREFIKGHGDDEERLMRRIMIARRNNLRDHETLKKARANTKSDQVEETDKYAALSKKRKTPPSISDSQITKEMDVGAVEATRSYRKWQTLSDGQEFVYNQTYTKGKEGHDWLLRKNIWRRMRYRRENKKLIESYKSENPEGEEEEEVAAAEGIVDQALMATGGNGAAATATTQNEEEVNSVAAAAAAAVDDSFVSKSVVEAAAVAAAEQFAKTAGIGEGAVHNPLEAAATDAALDAAAKLAAAAAVEQEEEEEHAGVEVMQV